jgi:hypothetical protein
VFSKNGARPWDLWLPQSRCYFLLFTNTASLSKKLEAGTTQKEPPFRCVFLEMNILYKLIIVVLAGSFFRWLCYSLTEG